MEKKNIIVRDNVLWIDNIFWDINAFRPGLKENLSMDKVYKADVKFEEENLQNGNIIKYPKKIVLKNISGVEKNFINIR
jgi:hypothetical protein